jgi:hypothetical protein
MRLLPPDDDVPPEAVLRYHARRLNGRNWHWPLLQPSFHTFAGALCWLDEYPVWWRLSELKNALRFLWHYRTGLMLGENREWGEFWELGLRLFPRWVGFHASRRCLTRRNWIIYRAGHIATIRCVKQMEQEIEGFDSETS